MDTEQLPLSNEIPTSHSKKRRDREAWNAYMREYIRTHPEYRVRKNAHTKAWRKENPERSRALKRQSDARVRARDPEGFKTRHNEASKRHRENKPERLTQKKIRARIFEILGETCVRCGFNDKRALWIDHVLGDGAAERKRLGVYQVYLKIIATKGKGYQMLCANCQAIKKAENREYRGRKSP